MPYKKSLRTLVATLVLASLAAAQQQQSLPEAPDAGRLRADVTYLASEKLDGRRTGTPGAEAAAKYIAGEYKRLGLSPGAPDYFQQFPYVAGVELGKQNAMAAAGSTGDDDPETLVLRVGEDWMPLGFSSNARVPDTPAVFAGYGITSAEQGYDDYAGAGVKGRVAVIFSGTPDGDNPHGRFTRAGGIRFKAAAARAAGARALVVIAKEADFKDERLARLRYDNSGGDAGLPVVVVSRAAGAKILGLGSADKLSVAEAAAPFLKEPSKVFEQGIDLGKLRPSAVALTTDIVRRNAPASNVIGVLEGSDPQLKSEVIVVGAHYDHLGRGGEGSLAGREGDIHHGADDNASGTAALLELARLLSKDRKGMRRTVVFAAFGGEEEGLIGSSFYVANPARPLEQTVAMLNMDMVGRMKGGVLNVGGVGTAAEWRGWIEGANRAFKASVDPMGDGPRPAHGGGDAAQRGARVEAPIVVTGSNGRVVATATPVERFTLRLNEDGFGPSDHSSFYAKRVPVLFFFTGAHEDYHKPSDTADRINYEGLAGVTRFVREIVRDLQASDKRPTFAVAKSEAGSRSTGFRVYLGTVPSYADSSDGMKLDAVREGSPAAAAGLRAGDKIVKLAGRDVRNVYDYTQALSEMNAGQEYEVELMRDGQRITLKLTPAARR